MAGLVIILMLAIGWESPKYSIPVDEFMSGDHRVNDFVRLDGEVENIELNDAGYDVLLCHNRICIQAVVPNGLNIIFGLHDRVMMAGEYRGHTLEVTQVVKRCHD